MRQKEMRSNFSIFSTFLRSMFLKLWACADVYKDFLFISYTYRFHHKASLGGKRPIFNISV